MPAAPQGGGQGDNSAGILWGVVAIFAAIGAIWYVFKAQLVTLYLTVKLYELSVLTFFSNLFNHPYYFEPLRQTLYAARAAAANIGYNDLIAVGSSVGVWLRIPFVIVLLVLAIVVYLGNTTRAYKRTYTMRDFAKLESKNWPQITPVINLDLIKTDIDTGPWAMAMTPMQFCKRHKLLEEVRPQRREGMHRKEWDRIEVVLKRGETNKIFAMQLGPLWGGSNRLPPYARALFAVFAARINADSQTAAKILMQIAASSLSTQLNLAGVDALLKKHENTKLVQQVVQSHAYVTTVMSSMLLAARGDGVQASSDFLWLKPMDRRLWYTLNTVGRQTPFIEVAGIFAHWVAEREAGRKLLVPMVEEATNAVELALKEVVYRPDEEE
ncbi:MAG: type IVB secretion system coupling complex protein DotM/IcmP [Gammaproteobacteria bacterium]|nr:type IVB secretion system coupling complex protein DotM/IcmP [Gammaproteobacteria bacterium]MCW5582564.1 type IVB secretion system coupling complex protein DotM/IcmP [Gammaproteobacteria bacterium]